MPNQVEVSGHAAVSKYTCLRALHVPGIYLYMCTNTPGDCMHANTDNILNGLQKQLWSKISLSENEAS